MPKTMDDIKQDMTDLYERVKAGTIDLKVAKTLAQVTQANLKAEQLKLNRQVFESDLSTGVNKIRPEAPAASTN